MQQAAHTTSDLLRLLAAEGAPFADVAAAVAARFGGDPASRAWLARTLVTLLRVRLVAWGGRCGTSLLLWVPVDSIHTLVVAVHCMLHPPTLHPTPPAHRTCTPHRRTACCTRKRRS